VVLKSGPISFHQVQRSFGYAIVQSYTSCIRHYDLTVTIYPMQQLSRLFSNWVGGKLCCIPQAASATLKFR